MGRFFRRLYQDGPARLFLKLLLLSAVIVSPLAWFIINKWLQNYAYRIDISWWMFLAPGSGATLIALITVVFQEIRTAFANPVKILRAE